MCDIALGIRELQLEEFAASVHASWMSQWRELGLFDDDVEGWGGAFAQVIERTLVAGGRVHFNLTGLNISEALSGDPEVWIGRYTAWELQQVLRQRVLFSRTIFYVDGRMLNADELTAIGIVLVATS